MTAQSPPREARQGVFFLASDPVMELAIAFLNSFRAHNPELPLCLVPFDSEYGRLESLQDVYRFSILRREEPLRRCDAISERFHGRVVGHYRKLAMWDGPFEEFIYIDLDTVVLAPVDLVFQFLRRADFVTASSNGPALERWVWKPSMRACGLLDDAQRSYSANTGFIASRRGALSLGAAEREALSARVLAPHMNLACQEQPFLNWLIVTSGRQFTSLAVLAANGHPYPIRGEYWAGLKGGRVRGGTLQTRAGWRPALIVHWAGEWQPRRWERVLDGMLLALRVRRAGPVRRLRRRLPYRPLWEHYRRLNPTRPQATSDPGVVGDERVRGREG